MQTWCFPITSYHKGTVPASHPANLPASLLCKDSKEASRQTKGHSVKVYLHVIVKTAPEWTEWCTSNPILSSQQHGRRPVYNSRQTEKPSKNICKWQLMEKVGLGGTVGGPRTVQYFSGAQWHGLRHGLDQKSRMDWMAHGLQCFPPLPGQGIDGAQSLKDMGPKGSRARNEKRYSAVA